MADQQPEALRLAQALNNRQECEDEAADELRRLHAELSRLQAAGGQGVDQQVRDALEFYADGRHEVELHGRIDWIAERKRLEGEGFRHVFEANNGAETYVEDGRRAQAALELLIAHPPAAPALVPLNEQEIVKCIIAAGCIGTVKMSYESGPYDIDRASMNATKLAYAITSALAARNGLTVGEGEALSETRTIVTGQCDPACHAKTFTGPGECMHAFCPLVTAAKGA